MSRVTGLTAPNLQNQVDKPIQLPAMKLHAIYIAILLIGTVCTGCNSVPGYVITPEDMASLMADLLTGEAAVEANFGNYPTDSARMLLKQSILERHGISAERLDTSFMWYGAHLDIYDEVNDRTIEILEQRIAEERNPEYSTLNESVSADSVNLWNRPSFLIVKPSSPSRNVTYEYKAGQDWKKGDVFTIRAKFANVTGHPSWTMTASYTDGSIEVLSTRFSGDGWHEMSFFTDSVKTAAGINGSLEFNIGRAPMVVDSISIIRKALIPRLYTQRYRQNTYNYFKTDSPESVEVVNETENQSGEVVKP